MGFLCPPKNFSHDSSERDDSLWGKVPTPEDMEAFSISHFLPYLSDRMKRVIRELRIETVGQLSQTPESDLYAKGAGAAGVYEVAIGILKPKGPTLTET